MLRTYTLKNGLKVATYEIPQMRSAFLSLAVKAGSIFENEKNNGVAHFMEHIILQGIPSFPTAESLHEYVERLAGSFNASTGTQTIRFTMNAPAKSIDDMLKIGSECFFQPLFSEDSIEKERNAVMEEIHRRIDALWYKNWKFWSSVRYKKGHPLLLDGGGGETSVKKLKRKDLVDYWSTFFHPQNTYLVVVGGIKNDQIKKLVEKNFGGNNSKKPFIGYPNLTNKDFSDRTIAIENVPDLKTCYLDLTFAGPEGDVNLPIQDRVVQSVIRSILVSMRRSRLYRLLRTQKGLVYGISMSNALYETFGYAEIETEAAPDNLDLVINLIAQELIAFCQKGPTAEELDLAKNFHINRTLMSFDTPSGVASWIEGDLMWEKKAYTPEEYVKIIEKVDYQKIMAFMKKYWDFSKLNLTIRGPLENSKKNRDKFAKMLEDLK